MRCDILRTVPCGVMSPAPGILARGPWSPDQVEARWSDAHYVPSPEATAAVWIGLAAAVLGVGLAAVNTSTKP